MWPDAPGWQDLDDIEMYDPVAKPLSGSVAGHRGAVPGADELAAQVKHEAGLADPPPRRRPPGPDVHGLAEDLGLT